MVYRWIYKMDICYTDRYIKWTYGIQMDTYNGHMVYRWIHKMDIWYIDGYIKWTYGIQIDTWNGHMVYRHIKWTYGLSKVTQATVPCR